MNFILFDLFGNEIKIPNYSHLQCDGRFSAKETLNRHVKVHTGERPHKCTYCPKSFIQSTQLRAHMFHHTGENAFTCTHCGDKFGRKNRLDSHIKSVHENPKHFTCDICSKEFCNKNMLRAHLSEHNVKRGKLPMHHYWWSDSIDSILIFLFYRKPMRNLQENVFVETIASASWETNP